MTMQQAEALHTYMEAFVADSSIKNAAPLFKELNKHEMYLTVLRLHDKYDLDQKLGGIGAEYGMDKHYQYARDHVEGMKTI